MTAKRAVHTIIARAAQLAGIVFTAHAQMLRHAKGHQLKFTFVLSGRQLYTSESCNSRNYSSGNNSGDTLLLYKRS